MGSAGNVPERQRWCPAAHREWQVAGVERPQGRDSQHRKFWSSSTQEENLFMMERREAPCRGSSKSTPRVLQITTKWERRGNGKGGALEGPPGKRWAETSSPASWSESLQKIRATSPGSVITGNVNRHASKEGSDGNAGSHPVSIFKTHRQILFPGSPPTRLPPPLLLGSRSWTAWTANWRYLGSFLKSQSF